MSTTIYRAHWKTKCYKLFRFLLKKKRVRTLNGQKFVVMKWIGREKKIRKEYYRQKYNVLFPSLLKIAPTSNFKNR